MFNANFKSQKKSRLTTKGRKSRKKTPKLMCMDSSNSNADDSIVHSVQLQAGVHGINLLNSNKSNVNEPTTESVKVATVCTRESLDIPILKIPEDLTDVAILTSTPSSYQKDSSQTVKVATVSTQGSLIIPVFKITQDGTDLENVTSTPSLYEKDSPERVKVATLSTRESLISPQLKITEDGTEVENLTPTPSSYPKDSSEINKVLSNDIHINDVTALDSKTENKDSRGNSTSLRCTADVVEMRSQNLSCEEKDDLLMSSDEFVPESLTQIPKRKIQDTHFSTSDSDQKDHDTPKRKRKASIK